MEYKGVVSKMNKTRLISLGIVVVLLLFLSCAQRKHNEEPQKAHNKLTDAEKQQGWELLFDGETTHGMRNYLSQDLKSQWVVEDGTLHYLGMTDEGRGGDVIVTDKPYSEFEFSLEWKISEGGNSGIIYLVVEDSKYEKPWHTGLEYQLLDNEGHADGQIDKHKAGDLYDLVESDTIHVNPAAEWNRSKIKMLNGRVEHWLNGYKIVDMDTSEPEWATLIAGSKFSDKEDFAKASEGHIVLQDHTDPVWFRNIKIRSLSAHQAMH